MIDPGLKRALHLLALALALGCGGPGRDAPVPPPLVATATGRGLPNGSATSAIIGAEGGALAAAGGAVTVTLPPGSVGAPSVVTALPISSRARGAVGASYRIESSERLAGPVKLTFRGLAAYPSGVGVGSLGIRFQDARGFWVPPEVVTRDAGANTLTATTSHLSDWTLVLDRAPSLEGTFTLVQSVRPADLGGPPFTATGTLALFAWEGAPEPTWYLTGTATIPAELTDGTVTCTVPAPAQDLELGVAEVHAGQFRWGANARWTASCTDTATGASFSQELATVFDTMRISNTSCPAAYVGEQVVAADRLAGGYLTDCGPLGTVSATWDVRGCTPGGLCQPAEACREGAVSCDGAVSSCVATGPAPDGTACGVAQVCAAGACVAAP
jgi:hypothetical protein